MAVSSPVEVVVLNGGSSSGTTSIARELQAQLERPSLLLGVDTLIDAMPAVRAGRHDAAVAVGPDGTVVPGPAFRALESAWYRGLAEMARAGALLIVDEVLLGGGASQARLAAALSGLRIVWVGVRCDAAVATAREASRPDRSPGMAATQASAVHRGVNYDLTVDTTHRSAADCARTVAGVMTGGRTSW